MQRLLLLLLLLHTNLLLVRRRLATRQQPDSFSPSRHHRSSDKGLLVLLTHAKTSKTACCILPKWSIRSLRASPTPAPPPDTLPVPICFQSRPAAPFDVAGAVHILKHCPGLAASASRRCVKYDPYTQVKCSDWQGNQQRAPDSQSSSVLCFSVGA